MKYFLKYGRQGNLMIYFFDFATLSINKIEKWTKCCFLLFLKKGDFGITKNYRCRTPIAAKVYNALLLNHIKLKIEKILRKNLDGFRKNRSTTS